VDKVTTLTDHLTGNFGTQYGVFVKEERIFRRAVWVVNRNGKIVYSAYLPALGVEPDYNAVLEATRQALAG
jgi:thiol peroxidase